MTCIQQYHLADDPLVSLNLLRGAKLNKGETLQSHLTTLMESKRINQMKQSMELKQLEWWQNQRNDMSGQPLLAFPSMGKYIIRSAEFKTWLLHRYLIPNGFGGFCCDCAARPQLDPYGIHLSCGCNKEGLRTGIHDALVLELQSLFRYAGFWTTHEERHMFDNNDKEKNNRPDLVVNNPELLGFHGTGPNPKQPDKVIIDLSFTCPLDGASKADIKAAPNRTKALEIGSKADARYNDKFKHYKTLIADLDPHLNPPVYWIVPFVFQSTGLLHKKGLELLERIAGAAQDFKKIPGSNLLTYFKRRISCCLAKNLANSINQRGRTVASHSGSRLDRSFDSRHIMELHTEN